jgi:hypothetical protein
MSDDSELRLSGGSEIRAWTDRHPPTLVKEPDVEEVGGEMLQDLPEQGRLDFDESNLVPPAGQRKLHGVQHFFFDANGMVLFLFARVYDAVNTEHALHQYLYAEAPERRYGRGVDHVFAKLYDSNFRYEEQEIRVFPLWVGSDVFE